MHFTISVIVSMLFMLTLFFGTRLAPDIANKIEIPSTESENEFLVKGVFYCS